MKNRKRVLALLLTGFLSVTTAFQSTAVAVYATEGTEVITAVEDSSEDDSSSGSAASTEEKSTEESSTEGNFEDAGTKESSDESSEAVSENSSEEEDTDESAEEATVEEAAAESTEEDKKVEITPISEVLAAESGNFTVAGVVNYVSGKNVYVQDETGAICVYLAAADKSIEAGNLLTASGDRTVYNGLIELGSAVVVSNDKENTVDYGFTTFEAKDLKTLVDNHDDYECKKLIIKGVTVSSVTSSKVIVTGADASLTIYGSGTGAKFADFPAGSVVNVTAVMSDYKGAQVILISDADHPEVEAATTEEDDDEVVVDDSVTLEIAKWAGSALTGHESDLVIYADGTQANDCADTENEITAFIGGNQTSPVYTYSSSGTQSAIIGSKGMSAGDYYQITVSGKGYGLYKLSFSTKGSNTGAKNWKVSYSTDGETFTDVKSYYVSTNFFEFNCEVPATAVHVDKLVFRVGPSDNTSINGKTVAAGGVNRFMDIKVTGSPVSASNITGVVDVSPAEGEVPVNQELTMSCATKDATILYSVNDSEFNVYDDSSKPVLAAEDFVAASELDPVKKAKVVVYATSEGRDDSVKKTFVYTQAQVANVKASPNGGAIRKSSPITLATATEGAKIVYSLDKGESWTEYVDPFRLSTLPATLMAKATCEGYSDSPVSTFEYTERLNEEYNIYFGQLHSHTSYSDGAGTADEAFNHAANEVENLDFLAVTDHSNSYDNDTSVTISDGSASSEWVEGHELADKYTSEDFVGLFGYEMTWSGGAPGHINTFNTNGFMSRNMTGYESKSRTALQNYYAQLVNTPDSISMFNHPGTTFGDFYDFAYYSKANDQQITLIEVGNGEGAIGSAGYFPSYEYYTRALDKGWHIAPANNQDNHKGRWGDANTGRTVILADSLTRENIYDAIRNMRVYATEDNDLNIYYTLNGMEMGSILDETPSEVNIKVKTSDATDSSTMTVEVIANGGVTVASERVEESSAETTFTLSPNYNYYYIRVTQADGNIAVTAPVWLSNVEAVGVGSIAVDTSLPVAGEELHVNANFYNNEATDFEVSSIVYTMGGEVIHTSDVSGDLSVIKAQGELNDSFAFTQNDVGMKHLEVTLLGYLGGVSKKYTSSLDITYISPEMVTHVVVDGTHLNDYVAGYYGGNVGNFADIAAGDNVKVDVISTQITKEVLDNCSVLVISAPNKNTKYGDVKHFEDDFIELVKEYVAAGGNLIVCGLADYQDTKDCQTSTEINKLLEGIGATTRLNSDEIVDDEKNGGQNYRLYFNNFNRDSYLTKGISDTQTYSAYSACSVLVDEAAVAEGKVEPIVYGHSSTYTMDSKKFDELYKEVTKGNVVAAAREQLSSGADILVTGTVFLSNFEVKSELDYGGQEYYANRNILLNYLSNNRKEIKVSTIAELRAGEPGEIFTIEGYVTAGTAVEGNKFFDTIYVQDETAGTTVFPVAEAGIELGTKLRLTGYVDGYQGDKEIQVVNYTILDDEHKIIEPKLVSTKEAADYNALGGSLLKVAGKVTRVVTNSSGVDYFYVMDDSGVEARVFIDGYILASDGNDTVAEDAVVGNTVSAVGLSYYNPDGACLRVRDRAEIVLEASEPENKAELVTKWGSTYLIDADGNKLTGFQTVDGKLLYFNNRGVMQKQSWITVDGAKYYAKADGEIARNEMISKWGSDYIIGEDATLQTGFVSFQGNDYYSNAKGIVTKSDWIETEAGKYYAKADGTLAKNETITKWFKKYTFDENGLLVDSSMIF